jgi:basic amino acid/polyamine antiporter, APA family
MEAVYPPKVGRPFFVREATGLIRELSWFDTFLCGFGILNVALGLVQAFAYAPYVFPGSNMAVAFIIALPGAFFIGLLNALFTAAMPRSGGDYIWVSRAMSPVVGFAVNFFATFGIIAAAAVNIWYMAQNFLVPALYVFGLEGAAAWAAQPQSALILGIFAVALLVLIFSLGLNVVRRTMLVLFIVTAIGTLTWLALMVFGSNQSFIAGFNGAFGTNAYQNLIATAQTAGRTVDPASSGRNSFYALIFGFQMYGGFQMIGYFAGEIKRVHRSAIQAIMTALVVGALFFIFGALLVTAYFGKDFIGAVAFLANEAPDQLNLPLGSYLSSFTIYMTTSPILRMIVSVGFLATILWILLPQMLIITRNMFAWSFDRLIPSWVAEVNERTHSPIHATILAGILIYIMLLVTLLTPFWAYLVNLAGVGALVGTLVAISAILFPYRRKDIFEKAPALVKKTVFNIPLLTWAGIFTLITQLVVVVVAFTIPAIGGPVSMVSLLASLAVFLLAFPLYLIPYYVNRSKGLDPSLAYKELPPE